MFINRDEFDEQLRHLRALGYWACPEHPTWPDPHNFVDLSWDAAERETVFVYLCTCKFIRDWGGYSWCRFKCGIGARSDRAELTDEDIDRAFEGAEERGPTDLGSSIAAAYERDAARIPARLRSEDMGTSCLSNGTYIWPEGLAHYVKEHGVRPPHEFVQHVLREVARRSPEGAGSQGEEAIGRV